ncbi:DENN domain-containing protein 3-like [Mytilus edulis]|uniref:DENN domain-containing protein 3-like n=1 Tax=Mytilus edulis TaxID=6550 RepID=UPI0039EF1031
MSGRKLVEDDDGIHFLNSFVDLLLVIGLDDNSGLIPYDGKEEESITLEDLFLIQYEPQVLSAASSKVMMHFFPHARQDLDYPRIRRQPKDDYIYKRTALRSIDNLTQSRFHKTVNVSRHTAPVSVSRHMSIRGTTIKKNKMTTSVPEFPVSEEVIKSITTFCYPDGMKVFPEKRENFVHFLVLTDIMGNKTYATCLTFNRRFIIEKGEKSKIWMNLDTSSDDLEKQQVRCYIPHCCVLISKFPYFTVMKDALSYMVSRMEADPEEMYSHIKDITHTLTMTPIPLAGRLALEVEIEGESLFLYPPEKPDKPVIDIPLHLVFLCFNSNEILKILSAILLEERIVFISSSYALLTTIMQSFLYFILPFEWRYSFVPILTIEALELLEAPGTFMMGCHKIHRKEVEQIEGVVVVDIDEGSVAVNPVIEMTTNQSDSIESLIDIPEIPDEAAKLFSKVCKRALYQHDLVELQRPVCFDIRKRRKMEKMKVQQLNSSITAGCLELMVNLYRGVMSEIRLEHQRFNKQAFLDSIQGLDKKFYERALNTDMFKIFLKDRMSQKQDYWSQLEVLTRPQVKKAGGTDKLANRRAQLKKQVSVTFLPGLLTRKETKIFKLPRIQRSLRTYIINTIDQLSDCWQKSNDLQDRASYLYLRGAFYLADHKAVEALGDLTRLAEIDISLVPELMVKQAYQKIPEDEKYEILMRPGIQHLSELLHLESDGNQSPKVHHKFEEPVKLPDHDLNFEEFRRFVTMLEMTQDMETVMRLFQALELNQHNGYDKVDIGTFETFNHCYQENLEHCLRVEESILDHEEYVLKLSLLCKTDLGSGRIVLTNKRLLFMKDGSMECTEVTKIRDIVLIEQKQLKSFFKTIDVLRIHKKDDAKFTAWLKDERDHWFILLQELWAGKVVSMGTKDIMAANKAANNVQLVDAFLKSSQDQDTTHHDNPMQAVTELCFYTRYMKEKRHELPRETLETLVNRIDPCSGESLRQTVQSLLYTPGDPQQHVLPRLWCGMGDGKIKIFDAMAWNLESHFIQTKTAVMCLADVGGRQIWAGSYYIYIIDVQTLRCNRAPLTDHADSVVSIVVVNDGRYVYTASADGDILKWDVQTITVVDKCRDKIKDLRRLKFYNGFLWCGTKVAVYRIDLSGNLLQKYPLIQSKAVKAGEVSPEIDSFHISESGEIWAGYRRSGIILIWDSTQGTLKEIIDIPKCEGISSIVQQEHKVWVGSKDGIIHIINTETRKVVKRLQAHDDAVRALCCAQNRYIISGAGSRDGRIAMWSSTDTKTASGKFILDE